jgi:hypothetical protein
MKLISKIAERFSVHLPIVAVFQHPTVQQMGQVVESMRDGEVEWLNADGMELEKGAIEPIS